jgi:hypothetical protein
VSVIHAVMLAVPKPVGDTSIWFDGFGTSGENRMGLHSQSTPCIRAGRQRPRLIFAHRVSRRVPKCRSRFGDQEFAKRRRPSICAVNEEASNVIAGLDPAIHLLARMMDTRVIKPAYDGF